MEIGFMVFAGILGAIVIGLLILSAMFAGGNATATDYTFPSQRL